MLKDLAELLSVQFSEVSDIVVSVQAVLELSHFPLQSLSKLTTQLISQL